MWPGPGMRNWSHGKRQYTKTKSHTRKTEREMKYKKTFFPSGCEINFALAFWIPRRALSSRYMRRDIKSRVYKMGEPSAKVINSLPCRRNPSVRPSSSSHHHQQSLGLNFLLHFQVVTWPCTERAALSIIYMRAECAQSPLPISHQHAK
jgi:hypothetical protein